MSRKLTLGKKERLKSRKRIESLFSGGKHFHVSPLRVLYQPGPKGLQAGVGVSSRHFKKAVVRNRIRRQIREAWRVQKTALQDLLASQQRGLDVFLMYQSKEIPEFRVIEEAVGKSINQLINRWNEKAAPNS